MKKGFKLNPITIMMLVILAMAIVVNAFTTITGTFSSDAATVQSYTNAMRPLYFLDIIKIVTILLMVCWVYFLVKKVVNKEKWNEKYYHNIKTIGWLSVFIFILDAISFVIKEDYISKGKNISSIAADPAIYANVVSQAVFSSPVAWFLVACIFLIADVLEYSNTSSD